MRTLTFYDSVTSYLGMCDGSGGEGVIEEGGRAEGAEGLRGRGRV